MDVITALSLPLRADAAASRKDPLRPELGKPDGCDWSCHGNTTQGDCDPAEYFPVMFRMAFGSFKYCA